MPCDSSATDAVPFDLLICSKAWIIPATVPSNPNSGATTVTGNVSGAGALTASGSGTLVLTGTSALFSQTAWAPIVSNALGGTKGLLARVARASQGHKAELEQHILRQARQQLGLPQLQVVQTIVEKRATFACTPGLLRPGMQIAPGLLACGDYVQGPYPATLEGAVRSGLAAARAISADS